MKKLIVIGLLFSSSCIAQDISPTGTIIEVENYKCTVMSPRHIECQNIGRVCVAYRKMLAERNEKEFGCAIINSRNYPCKEWTEILNRIKKESDLSMSCSITLFGFGQ